MISLWACGIFDTGESTGGIQITLVNQLSAKTLLPAIDMNIALYDIRGFGPGGDTFEELDYSGESLTIDRRRFGDWTVSVDGGEVLMEVGGSVAVSASVVESVGNVVYVWYINGESVTIGENHVVSGLEEGVYRLDVTAFTADGTRAGSATHDFQVVGDLVSYGLLAYFPFNGNANDKSGNGNDGTVTSATLTTDRFGNVGTTYYFDGENDYIEVAVQIFGQDVEAFTVHSFVQLSDTTATRSIMHFGKPDMGEFSFGLDNGTLRFQVKLNDGNWYVVQASDDPQPVSWYSIAGVYRRGHNIQVYLAGQFVAQLDIPIADLHTSSNLKNGIGSHFDGSWA